MKGDNPIEIQWTLNGEKITIETHPDIMISSNSRKISFLVIDSVAAHHAGEYTCVANNSAGSASRSATLAVNGTSYITIKKQFIAIYCTYFISKNFYFLLFQFELRSYRFSYMYNIVAPAIVEFAFGNRPANSGDSISATCAVSAGDQPMEFAWFFNSKPFSASDFQDVSISTTKRRSILEIEAVNANHAGTYTCTVSNKAGAASHSSDLIVNGKQTDIYIRVLSFLYLEKLRVIRTGITDFYFVRTLLHTQGIQFYCKNLFVPTDLPILSSQSSTQ